MTSLEKKGEKSEPDGALVSTCFPLKHSLVGSSLIISKGGEALEKKKKENI